jgi:GR25 family glycosyltransferase involved in LPS biosynthesis
MSCLYESDSSIGSPSPRCKIKPEDFQRKLIELQTNGSPESLKEFKKLKDREKFASDWMDHFKCKKPNQYLNISCDDDGLLDFFCQERLSNGWIQINEPDGTIFYWNENTHESTMDLPVEARCRGIDREPIPEGDIATFIHWRRDGDGNFKGFGGNAKKTKTKTKRKRKKRKTKTKTKKRKTRKNVNIPKIFVINLKKDKDKWNKYKNDDRYIRYSACNGIEMSKDNPYYDRLQIMWNVKEKKKKCTAGILNSHMTIIKKIVKNKIDQALIIEDDAIIDFKLLKKINLDKLPQDSIIYFGGSLHPPDTFKNKTWSHEKTIKTFKKGINKIDPEKFRILGGHGYYFPKWEHAKQLIDIIDKKKKIRALDTEMVKLQRSGIIKYFYYPAISYLNTEDARKGVHAIHMSRDMKFYGG